MILSNNYKAMVSVLIMPLLIATCSCTAELPQTNSKVLLGDYEVIEVTIDQGDDVLMFSPDNNNMMPQRMVFISRTEVVWYDYYNDQWNEGGTNTLKYNANDELIKIGCRAVVDYSSKHITWEQDDWLITRKFK